MKKLFVLVLKIFLIIILMQGILVTTSNASSLDDVITQGDAFISQGKDGSGLDLTDTHDEIDSLYNVLFAIGVVVSVVWGAVLGVKFIMGSIEQQADVKKALIPYIAGCIVIYGAFTIWKIVILVMQNVTK